MTERSEEFREWKRHQWVGDNADGDFHGETNEAPAEPAETRWNKANWVGDDGSGDRPAPVTPEEMPDGESGLSGLRHNPGVQHWADGDSTRKGA